MTVNDFEQIEQSIKTFKEKIEAGNALCESLDTVIEILKKNPDTIGNVTKKVVIEELEFYRLGMSEIYDKMNDSVKSSAVFIAEKTARCAKEIEDSSEKGTGAIQAACEQVKSTLQQQSSDCTNSIKNVCEDAQDGIKIKADEVKNILTGTVENCSEKLSRTTAECAGTIRETCEQAKTELHGNADAIIQHFTQLRGSVVEREREFERISENLIQRIECTTNDKFVSICEKGFKRERNHFIVMLIIGLIIAGLLVALLVI